MEGNISSNRGNFKRMVTFLQICQETEEKLGRQLQDKEVVFLQWVYSRYLEELPKKMLNA